MEAPTSRRSQGTRVGHTNSFRRRITRLDRSRSSASTSASSDQRDGARESAHHTRARPQGSRDGSATTNKQTGTPNDRGTTRRVPPRGEPALPCRGCLARRGHHLALRPALGCATGAATNRRGWSVDSRPHGVKLGVNDARPQGPYRPRVDRPLRSQDGAASLELIQQQQVIVAGQRGVIMRGPKRITVLAASSKASANERCRSSHATPAACRWAGRRVNARARPPAGTAGRA